MSKQQESPPPFPEEAKLVSDDRISGFRFSLRTLFVLSTAICLLLGLGSVLPSGLIHFLCTSASLVITSVSATGILFARGEQRAFCVGVLLAMLFSTWTESGGAMLQSFMKIFMYFPWVDEGYSFDSAWMMPWVLTKHLVQFSIAAANGFLCIYAKRYFDRTNPPQV